MEIAFFIFLNSAKEFPDTAAASWISEKTSPKCKRNTFLTKIMCKRRCHPCVGLCYSITEWAKEMNFPLALDRISSHPVECHFGTTRNTLDGETRLASFLNAEINTLILRRSIAHIGLRPYIRRFKTETGCTLPHQQRVIAEVPLGFCIPFLFRCAAQFAQGIENADQRSREPIRVFRLLAASLAEAGWSEKAGKSSLLFENCTPLRLFPLSKGDKGGRAARLSEEQNPTIAVKSIWSYVSLKESLNCRGVSRDNQLLIDFRGI
jgi:hypothetical protein